MLSAEQFEELVALIQVAQEHEPKASVRRAPRIENPCKTSITLMNTGNPEPAHEVEVKDISARGVCFHHSVSLKPGTAFILKLQGEGNQSASIFCVVVHTRDIDASTFQVGAEFTKLLDKKIGKPAAIPRTSVEDLMVTRLRSK